MAYFQWWEILHTLHKRLTFPLRISLMNFPVDLFTLKQSLIKNFHFLYCKSGKCAIFNTENQIRLLLNYHLYIYPTQSQDINWTNIRRSKDVQNVFWTSYIRSTYVLCLRGPQKTGQNSVKSWDMEFRGLPRTLLNIYYEAILRN